MTRLDKFMAFKDHPWLKRSFEKLTKDDLFFAEKLLREVETMGRDEYASMVVRLFLDKPKPKAWKELEELFIASI